MSRIVDSETFKKDREFAKFHKHDLSAEYSYEKLPWWGRIGLSFAPIQVAEVDFGQWDADDPKFGTSRRLPLYLFRHGSHVSVDYPHGWTGTDERLDCHCGYKHYFITSRFPPLQVFDAIVGYFTGNRKSPAAG